MPEVDLRFIVLGVLVVGCIATYSLLAKSVVDRCKKTDDHRTMATYVMSGNFLIPVPTTQYRYICPGGSDAWL